jgi:glucosamine 6-phosphate synthetase-like amidotransferase/phosphosugar isomerase protein
MNEAHHHERTPPVCGIAGFSRATPSSIPDGRALALYLAVAIEPRGDHATGFGWGAADGWPMFWKSAGAASKVAHHADLPTGLRTLIAHTRYATKGSPKDNRNNHPVVAPGLVLVHNGRVDNDDDLIASVGHERKGQVDSEALAALLSLGPGALGADHPSDLLGLVDGVAAIAWLDGDDPDVLHLARLAERPLVIDYTKRRDLLFASTAMALQTAARLAGLTLTDVEHIPEGTYLRVEAGRIMDRRRFAFRRPARAVPADVPRAKTGTEADDDWWPKAKVVARSKSKGKKGKPKVSERARGTVPIVPNLWDWDDDFAQVPRPSRSSQGITDYFDRGR